MNKNFSPIKMACLIVSLYATSAASAQTNIRMCAYQAYQTVEGDEEEDISSICNLYQGIPTQASYGEAVAQIDAILDKVGLFRNFEVEECQGINNAIAVTVPLENGDLDRFILYDNLFFTKVSGSTGTDWGLASILAHEVGHHLNGHTLKSGGSNHRIELQADEFSGFVLARMDCNLEDAQAAVSKMLPDEASATHPAKADRLASIERGWRRGNGKTIEVKKIDQNIENKIVENKIDANEITKIVTAEQVVAKYLDAIGGQENIAKIKTLRKKYSGSMDGTEMHFVENHVNPTTLYMNISVAMKGGKPVNVEVLRINNRSFTKNTGSWVETKSPNSLPTEKSATSGFIPEMGMLINDLKLDFLGTEEIDGNFYYKIGFTENDNQITKFYDVITGLLYMDNMISPQGDLVSTLTYASYQNVSGIKFPMKTTVNIPGGATLLMEFTDISVNSEMEQSIFDAVETVKAR